MEDPTASCSKKGVSDLNETLLESDVVGKDLSPDTDLICAVKSSTMLITQQPLQSDVTYWCNFCEFKSDEEERLLKHITEHIFHCRYCNFQSFSRAVVIEHSVTNHPAFTEIGRNLKYCSYLLNTYQKDEVKKRKISDSQQEETTPCMNKKPRDPSTTLTTEIEQVVANIKTESSSDDNTSMTSMLNTTVQETLPGSCEFGSSPNKSPTLSETGNSHQDKTTFSAKKIPLGSDDIVTTLKMEVEEINDNEESESYSSVMTNRTENPPISSSPSNKIFPAQIPKTKETQQGNKLLPVITNAVSRDQGLSVMTNAVSQNHRLRVVKSVVSQDQGVSVTSKVVGRDQVLPVISNDLSQQLPVESNGVNRDYSLPVITSIVSGDQAISVATSNGQSTVPTQALSKPSANISLRAATVPRKIKRRATSDLYWECCYCEFATFKSTNLIDHHNSKHNGKTLNLIGSSTFSCTEEEIEKTKALDKMIRQSRIKDTSKVILNASAATKKKLVTTTSAAKKQKPTPTVKKSTTVKNSTSNSLEGQSESPKMVDTNEEKDIPSGSDLCWSCGNCGFVTLNEDYLKFHLKANHKDQTHKYVAMLVSSDEAMEKIKASDQQISANQEASEIEKNILTSSTISSMKAVTSSTSTSTEDSCQSLEIGNNAECESPDLVKTTQEEKIPLSFKCSQCGFTASASKKVKVHSLHRHKGCVMYALDMKAAVLLQKRYIFFCIKRNCPFETKEVSEILKHCESCTPWLDGKDNSDIDSRIVKSLELTKKFLLKTYGNVSGQTKLDGMPPK